MSEKNEIRYQVYLNYLQSLNNFINESCGNYECFGNEIVNQRYFQRIQRNRNINEQDLVKLLRNAWFTEIQLNLPGQHPELINYSNHWAPVQLYYSCFLLSRSFLLASGLNVDPKHTKTLSAIGSIINGRPALFGEPISILCTGNPKNRSECYLNLSSNIDINRSISPLGSSEYTSFYDSYCMFLRTTRKRQLEKLYESWKKNYKKKRIAPRAKREYINALHPTSIFDVLYRLRLRSNYSDADMYLLNIENQLGANEYFESIRKICWHIFFVLELLVSKYIGKRKLRNIIDVFLSMETYGLSDDLLGKRWSIIQNLY